MLNNVVFVCTGNTCRSPMAEVLYRARLPWAKVSSCGVAADIGDPATENARAAVREAGLSLEGHVARMLTGEDMDARLLTMTAAHADAARILLPGADVMRLGAADIIDPYGEDLQRYRQCRDELSLAVDAYIVSEMELICFDDAWSLAAVSSFLENGGRADILPFGYTLTREVAGETELMRIAVLPQFRGMGRGGVLFNRIKTDNLFLEVRTGNMAARRLYESAGMKENGVRRGYYWDGEDAVMYKL